MKSVGELFDRIPQRQNLLLAVWRAAKGKRDRADAREFAANLDRNLRELSRRIQSSDGPLGCYVEFSIRDPKPRLISAPSFHDRVLHHAVMNVCGPVLEQFQVHHSYACRAGKGQFRALAHAVHQARRHGWFLKMDVRKFFESVPRARLLQLLSRRFREDRLIRLLEQLIDSWRPGNTAGLPIGSLVSQHLANFYLAHLDHHALQRLGATGYVRYMDDFVLWGRDRGGLKEAAMHVGNFCETSLGLLLNPWFINRTSHGMDFLGCRVFPGRLGLARKSRLRFRAKLNDLERKLIEGSLSEAEYQRRAESLVAWTSHSACLTFRQRCIFGTVHGSQDLPQARIA